MTKTTLENIEKVLKKALMIVVPDAPDTELYIKQLRRIMENAEDPVEAVHSSLMSRYTLEQVDNLMFSITLILTGVPEEIVALFLDVMEKDSVEYFESLTEEQQADITAVMVLSKILDETTGRESLPCTCPKCMEKAPEA